MSMTWNGDTIAGEVNHLAMKGAEAVAHFIADAARDLISTPAPLKVTSKGVRAASRATPGAPPRMVSQDLRRSVRVEENPDGSFWVGTHLPYGKWNENRGHLWLTRVLREQSSDIEAILMREVT